MLILAIEQSSDLGSIALLRDDNILAERSWDCRELRSSGLFTTLKDMMAAASLRMEDIETYAVDTGPGAYSGLRSSLAAVKAFAMPGNAHVYAVMSAEILAFEIMNEFSADKIQVVGDARRGQWWTCVYEKRDNMPVPGSEIRLTAENDFQPAADAIVVSPDWHRLKDKLSAVVSDRKRLISECRVPKAVFLGILACRKIRLGMKSKPLTPVYLHAAVKEKESVASPPAALPSPQSLRDSVAGGCAALRAGSQKLC